MCISTARLSWWLCKISIVYCVFFSADDVVPSEKRVKYPQNFIELVDLALSEDIHRVRMRKLKQMELDKTDVMTPLMEEEAEGNDHASGEHQIVWCRHGVARIRWPWVSRTIAVRLSMWTSAAAR